MLKILKRISLKKVAIGLVILLVVMQAFRIDKTNPPVDPSKDFITQARPTVEIERMIKNACYDCHSHETTYPWYTNVAPLSWWIKDHINGGRKHLNFSEWTAYSNKKMDKKLKGCVENIKEGDMPMDSYTWIHKNAVLTKEQQKTLADFFDSLRTHESDEAEHGD